MQDVTQLIKNYKSPTYKEMWEALEKENVDIQITLDYGFTSPSIVTEVCLNLFFEEKSAGNTVNLKDYVLSCIDSQMTSYRKETGESLEVSAEHILDISTLYYEGFEEFPYQVGEEYSDGYVFNEIVDAITSQRPEGWLGMIETLTASMLKAAATSSDMLDLYTQCMYNGAVYSFGSDRNTTINSSLEFSLEMVLKCLPEGNVCLFRSKDEVDDYLIVSYKEAYGLPDYCPYLDEEKIIEDRLRFDNHLYEAIDGCDYKGALLISG